MKRFNVAGHVLVPKHTKLSEKDKEEVLAKFNSTIDDFPGIGKYDAALHGLNVKQGDMVKIVRKSPTAGTTVFYRVVVV